jgi:hypothetical protein
MAQKWPSDIESKLATDYLADARAEVSHSLATYQGPERDRVVRCILHLSAGDAARVTHFVGAAAKDYRDVIYWAEYDQGDRHVRDFRKSSDG